jgi:hypothetical protein
MSIGRPPSQLCGAFHGRTEAFCGSFVEHPVKPASSTPKDNSKNHFAARFISSGRVCRTDFVAFNHFA